MTTILGGKDFGRSKNCTAVIFGKKKVTLGVWGSKKMELIFQSP